MLGFLNAVGKVPRAPVFDINNVDKTVWFSAIDSTVTESAGKVTHISDLSGNGNDLSLSSGAPNEMTYDATGINGHPTFISGDSDHDTHFQVGGDITIQDVFVVCRYRDGVDDIFPAAGSFREPSILSGTDGFNGYPRISGSSGTKRFLQPDSAGNVLHLEKAGGHRLDATASGSGGDPMPMSFNVYRFTFTEAKTDQFYFFGGAGGRPDAWRGEIAEIICLDSETDAATAQNIVDYLEDKYSIVENRANTLVFGQSLAFQLLTSNSGAARDAFHTELFGEGFTSGLLINGGEGGAAVHYDADTGSGAFLNSTNDDEGTAFADALVGGVEDAGIAFEDIDYILPLIGNTDENAITGGTITAAEHKAAFETLIDLVKARATNAKIIPLANVGNSSDSSTTQEESWTDLKRVQFEVADEDTSGDFKDAFGFYDLARSDSEHLTDAAYETLGERIARAIAHHEGKGSPNNPLGPEITSAVYSALDDNVRVTITHDDGTDLTNSGEVDDFWLDINGTYDQATNISKLTATEFLLYGGLTLADNDTVTINHAGGSSASQTLANVFVDNATNPLPLRPTFNLDVTQRTQYHFDGTDDRIDIGTVSVGTGDFSISFKGQFDAVGKFQHLISTDNADDVALQLTSGNNLRVRIGATSFTGSTAIAVDTDMHIVVNCDRDGNATIYRDGTLIETLDISSESAHSVDSDWYIGASGASATTAPFDGRMRELYIFDSLLDSTDRANLGNGIEPATATPIRHYRMDEGSGTTAIDQTGNQDGTLENINEGSFHGAA